MEPSRFTEIILEFYKNKKSIRFRYKIYKK